MRFIRAAREYPQDPPLQTIALYTDPDRHAMFVREADEAYGLGPALVTDPGTKLTRSRYADYGVLAQALRAVRAEAAWVGWGFVSEQAQFAELCRDLGVVLLGPSAEVMRLLSDKISAKRVAEKAGIPVAPWSNGPVETVADARQQADRIGFPLVIKATGGSGGRGICHVDTPAQLDAAFETARADAFQAFGDPTVFLEKRVDGARQIEVLVMADAHGTVWAAGVSDCTLQRHRQKLLEEAPSPVLSPAQDQFIRETAVRFARAAGYRNAGTVEFLFQPSTGDFAFLEMSAGLQAEHPVVECTTDLDLVQLQILVAQGGRLPVAPPLTAGHAIQLRLNAEDPARGFVSVPGRVDRLRNLAGPGIRVDTGLSEGDGMPAEFDSTIAKIIGTGTTRADALARLQRVLRESLVVVRGGGSNKSRLLDLLAQPDVRSHSVDIGWLDRRAAAGVPSTLRHAEVALLRAALESYSAQLALERQQFFASALRGRPEVVSSAGRAVELRHAGAAYSFRVHRLGQQEYRVHTGGPAVDVRWEPLNEFESWLTVGGERHRVVLVVEGTSYRIEVNGVAHCVDRDDGGVVRAPSPAVVVSVAVEPGQRVAAGDLLVVLESMKMETHLKASASGTVRRVMTMPHAQVGTGTPLLQVDPEGHARENAPGRVQFASTPQEAAPEHSEAQLLNLLRQLRLLMLGYDLDAPQTKRLLTELSTHRRTPLSSAEVWNEELRILGIFVDICALFSRQPLVTAGLESEAPSAESSLFAYLRMLDSQGEGLPAAFLDSLRRALRHYGLQSLERCPALEDSLWWLAKSHARLNEQIAPVRSVLERHLDHVESLSPLADDSFRTLLDRMAYVTGDLYPAISNLARELRYRYFDQRRFEQARREAYADVEARLEALAKPGARNGQEFIRRLVDCPYPLVGLFMPRFANSPREVCDLMLEVITARHYRIRPLGPFETRDAGGHPCVVASYEHDGDWVNVFTVYAEFAAASDVLAALDQQFRQVSEQEHITLDLYLWRAEGVADPDALRQTVGAILNGAQLSRPLRSLVVAVAGPDAKAAASTRHFFTWRPSANGYQEERIYRGVHPMMAKRLHFWRLTNFQLERLPSAEDIYLLRAVAAENPKDERLFACAEVRDLTPVRDAQGQVIELPHLERMFHEALAGIRLVQSRRGPHERLHWNRVLLYIWPPMNLRPDELDHVLHKLAPAADGLGLEQVVVRARVPNPGTGELRDTVIRISSPAGSALLMTFRPASSLQPMRPLSEYTQKVVRMRQRGFVYPYEIVKMLTPSAGEQADFPPGSFVEYDLDAHHELVPVDRPPGQNQSNIITGVITSYTPRYREGMPRVILLGDPSKDLGALAEPECRRIIAAIDLAMAKGLPLEWFALSAGAKISMTSGVENMDWIAAVLRRLVEFTQAGGEVNVVVDGINVGAQPYWNAESTMLMHTRGILVMTPKAAMVLTGKRALEYSGSVSAEDNQGIGGYDRVMGPNGQAQYFARDFYEACQILMRHYEHTYVAPGERFPRRAATTDPSDRDVRQAPYHGDGFTTVGGIFSEKENPGRKRSFDIRKVMAAVVDQDHAPLERWAGMRGADTGVVWDAHLGGYPVCLLGFESKPVPRLGFVPADGPDHWTAGTLFPMSSKKIARAINAASGRRPLVVLANLSGFDGSPESLRKLQLEYGAEIGRAVVNFQGPIVFCVISRYHGGAYVVFSRALNDNMEVVALEGTFASVIGGAPAAAVVFANEVDSRARKDPRLQALTDAAARAEGKEKSRLLAQWNDLYPVVHSEKLGEVAAEFDSTHSVHRALEKGALHRIIPPAQLRPYLIDAIERGMRKVAEASEARAVGVGGD
jgi:acetyl/propionyl-CoA carboxylase alpha subunit/acetyl-CoA carboxylase carboxyltransferase component